jgi:hypothetical protein
MYFFIPFLLTKQIWEKDWTLDLRVERTILTIASHVFSLKLLRKKNIYKINHCVSIVKKIYFFFMLRMVLQMHQT